MKNEMGLAKLSGAILLGIFIGTIFGFFLTIAILAYVPVGY